MESPENDRPEIVPPSMDVTARRELSKMGTVLSAIVVLAVSLAGVWMSWSSHRLGLVANPAAALSLIVGRIMELRDAISGGSPWERQLYSTLLVSTPRDVPIAIKWFEELVASSDEATASVELAILEAENGLTQKVADRVAAWNRLGGDFPAFAELIELAYLTTPDSGNRTNILDSTILEQLEAGWFRDHLTARLVTMLANAALPVGDQGPRVSLTLVRIFVGATLLIVITGLLSMASILARLRSDSTHVTLGKILIPPAWHTSTAFAVALRCAAVFLLLGIGVGFLTPALMIGEPLILTTVYAVGIAVLFSLYRKCLLTNLDETVAEAFGLTVSVSRVVPWVAVLAGATTLGDLAILWLGDLLGVAVHWTEWFLEDLVWGNYLELGLLLFALIVLGPIFEELLFRGLIFATLRQRFSFGVAAATSAALFSTVHGYGIAGTCALLWGGFLAAWSVEKTKSLLPAIIAHGVNNLLMALGLILFLRV